MGEPSDNHYRKRYESKENCEIKIIYGNTDVLEGVISLKGEFI
jgi:hypothetical protein